MLQFARQMGSRFKRILLPPFINLIDVGAAGSLPQPLKRNQSKINHILTFEPNRAEIIQHGKRIAMNTALWNQAETRPFYVMGEHGYGSSLLQPNPDYVSENYEQLKQLGDSKMAETWFERSIIKATSTMTTRTLDDVLDELNQLDLYHILKTDTQSADCYIFKGAEKFLSSSCIAIHSEQFVYPLYKDAILLDESTTYLAQFGFELAKKFPAHGTFHSQHDCVYMKKDATGKVADAIRSMYNLT